MKPRYPASPALILLSLTLLIAGIWAIPPSHAQGQVQVTAAIPAATEQGTINLNVKVNGKGFKNGANAKWFVTGTTDSGGVTVNSTTFVSSSEVTANITVADTAAIANFDIQVTNSDGRGGKGTELFKVTAKGGGNSTCPSTQPAPTSDTKCYASLPGCLDSTFDGIGYGNIRPGTRVYGAGAKAVVVQQDGKIIIVGEAQNASGDSDLVVIRYNADGGLDTSFGDADPFNPLLRLGFVTTFFTNGNDDANSLVLQPDSKIVVAGKTGNGEMAVARYNTDGALDAGFGNGGKVVVSFGAKWPANTNELALQGDGKFVLAGVANGQNNSSQIALARVHPNGLLDSSFGSGGKLLINPTGSQSGSANARGIAIQRVPAVVGEERIVIVASTWQSSNYRSWTLMRFKPNGATDTTFGVNGVVKTSFFGFHEDPFGLKIDSSNRIVASGSVYTASPTSCGTYTIDLGVARYEQDGALDVSFSGGKQTVEVYGGKDSGESLVLQADGKILTCGTARSSDLSVSHLVLVRFNADGSRDTSFGLLGNGVVTTDFYGLSSSGLAVAVTPADGRIVAAGQAKVTSSESNYMAVGRYLP